MEHMFESRERAMARLRELIEGDTFLERYALMYALEASDLGLVNRTVDAVEQTRRDILNDDRTPVRALLRERFGL